MLYMLPIFLPVQIESACQMNVLDVNDNMPKFQETPYTASIEEVTICLLIIMQIKQQCFLLFLLDIGELNVTGVVVL